jgi:hypothetical protein
MTDHQRETAFLRHLIAFDNTKERHALEASIAQVQRDARCVQRVTSAAAWVAILAVAGLSYGAILDQNFRYAESQLFIRILCDVGLAAVISVLSFTGLLILYRRKLNHLREECRQLAVKVLESRLGEPLEAPQGALHPKADNHEADRRDAAQVEAIPCSLDSLREDGVRCEIKSYAQEIPIHD